MTSQKSTLLSISILIVLIISGLIFSFVRISHLENRIDKLEHQIENPEPKILPAN